MEAVSIHTDAVKEHTFLHRYFAYTEATETPRAYDFWCGLWLLSMTVGRSLVIPRPYAPVFLNLYLVLCSDAGVTRKSSAIRMAERIYRAAGLHDEHITITASATPESLLHSMSLRTLDGREASVAIMVSELVTLLGRENYTLGMPGILTDLYDCPQDREVRRSGNIVLRVKNAYVCFLAASTPAWLVRAINPDVIEGGFTSRCLFVIEEQRKRRVAWPDSDADADAQVAQLVSSLHGVRANVERWQHRGLDLSQSAKEKFVAWYDRRSTTAHDPFTTSFEAREDHHVLRLAGLLAINDGSMLIDHNHLAHATKIIDHHKHTAAALFGGGREIKRMLIGIDKLRDVLTEAGSVGLSKTELLYKTRSHLKVRELDYALAIMHELEMVQQFTVRTGGRSGVVWRGTSKLLLKALNGILTEKLSAA
jgi:hypothetical protein